MFAGLKSVFKFCLSLLLAVQVWVWVSFLDVFWFLNGTDFIDALFLSVQPFSYVYYSFIYSIIPVAILYFLVHEKVSSRTMLIIYAVTGLLIANIYNLVVAWMLSGASGINLEWLGRHGVILMLAGGLSGIVFYFLSISSLLGKNTVVKVIATTNPDRRQVVSGLAMLLGSMGFAGMLVGPIRILKNSSKYVDLDLSNIAEGEYISVDVGKQTIWIFRRTKQQLAELEKNNPKLLDPESSNSIQPDSTHNPYRSIKPKYFIVEATCTHLGCMLTYRTAKSTKESGYVNDSISSDHLYCQCHGGLFDLAGRVYKETPPPTNLRIPEHEFISEHVVRIHYPGLKPNLL